MIHLNRLYENFNSEYNTSQNGFFRPVSDFVPAIHEISLDIWNKLCGLEPRSQKIQDWLIPFLVSYNVTVQQKPQYDYIPYPRFPAPDDVKNYEYYGSSRIIVEKERTVGAPGLDLIDEKGECIPAVELDEAFFPQTTDYEEKSIQLVPRNKWAAVTGHRTKGPTMNKPFMKQIEEGFQIAPRGVGVVVLDWYRKPIMPVFNYTTINNGPDTYIQFTEQGSVHLEWSEALLPVFLYRLGKRYGLNVKDQLTLQVRQLDKLFE